MKTVNQTFFEKSGETLTALLRGRLWLQVIVAMVAGIMGGLLLGPTTGWVEPKTATLIGNWLALPGQIFLTLIQMIVIPLIIASIIRGLASAGGITQLRVMGGLSFVYFVITTIIAITLGIVMAKLLQPGNYIEQSLTQSLITQSIPSVVTTTTAGVPTMGALPEKLVGLLPRNPLVSMVEGQMLQIVIFTIIFGVALVMMPRIQAKPLLDLMASLQEVCMTVVKWAMWLAPLAVFGMLVQISAKIGLHALLGMAMYVLTVLSGLMLLLIFYLLLLYVFTRQKPFWFLQQIREVLLLAFSTSSSAAVMPLSIQTAQNKLNVSDGVAQFVIPLGATINMTGTALYQGVATIFLAQVFAIDIGMGGILVIILMAVGASIGSPATPGVGIIVLALVLDSVGVPTSGIALIIGVDRILDMCRTAINVCGDLVAARLLQRWLPASMAPTTI